MATRIDGLSLVTAGWRSHHSALRIAVDSCRASLEGCHLVPGDIGLLINVGLYRDGNLGEPALAPLIQEDLGANPGDPRPGGTGTFSFDVANGTSGLLNALQIADGFLQSRTVERVLVVASDASPSRQLAPEFPYLSGGGAAVCRWSADQFGLGSFRWRNVFDGGASFQATVGLEGRHNILRVVEEPDFAERAAEAAVSVAFELLNDEGMTPADVDVVITDSSRDLFVKKIGTELEKPDEAIVSDPRAWHTAGLFAGIHRAQHARLLRRGTSALLLCGAAGVSAGAALYRL